MTGSVILAGGGSGGHLSPGLAVAERLQALSSGQTSVHFACSGRSIDRLMLEHAGASFHPISAAPFSVRPSGFLRFVRGLQQGTRQSKQLIETNEGRVVLALGGFVSAPVVRAANQAGLRTLLLNLDAVPGRANQWVARRAQEVYTALPLGDGVQLANLAGEVGFPVRRAAVAPADPATCRERLGLSPHQPTLLIAGASQGATSINRFIEGSLKSLAGSLIDWEVLHLSGASDRGRLESAYAEAGIKAVVLDFLDQMGLAWGAAELAVSRAGANSVAEVALNRVPTLFVPYPWHKDLHQQFNAQPLVDAGGAQLALDQIEPEANETSIGRPLRDLLLDPGRRRDMRTVLETLPARDGAMEIAKLLHQAML